MQFLLSQRVIWFCVKKNYVLKKNNSKNIAGRKVQRKQKSMELNKFSNNNVETRRLRE